MTKLGSRKLHIFPKVTKMVSIIGHRIDYNRAGALRGQQHIPSKNLPKYPPLPWVVNVMNVIQISQYFWNIFLFGKSICGTSFAVEHKILP